MQVRRLLPLMEQLPFENAKLYYFRKPREEPKIQHYHAPLLEGQLQGIRFVHTGKELVPGEKSANCYLAACK